MTASTFLNSETLLIVVGGFVAFAISITGGIFAVKERVRNNFVIYTASFALIFDFENSHYINTTPTFKAKTKNKIS